MDKMERAREIEIEERPRNLKEWEKESENEGKKDSVKEEKEGRAEVEKCCLATSESKNNYSGRKSFFEVNSCFYIPKKNIVL